MKKIALIIVLLPILLFMSSCDLVDSITGKKSQTVELYPVRVDGQWGYINKEGKIAIEPRFQNAAPFFEGLAAVRESGSRKYINKKGEDVIEGSFSSTRNFSEGKAAVQLDGRWGYISRSGKLIVNPKFRSAYPFSNGRAFVRSVDYREYYYIDEHGDKLQLSNSIDFIEENQFRDGYALVRNGSDYGYIDRSGNVVVEMKYAEARPFSNNLAAVKISDRWAFINGEGSVSINPEFISVGDFGNGLAPVRKNSNQFGYIDKSGNLVIEEQFEMAQPFSEDRAAVVINGRWTYIDKSGNPITSKRFDEVEPFYRGLARVTLLVPDGDSQTEHYGYINKSGDYVWFPTR